MQRYLLTIIFALLLAVPVNGQRPGADLDRDRLAQTGMKFLSISVAPRAAAIGNATTAVSQSSSSLFYNPAGMARISDKTHAFIGHVQSIGNFEYNAGSVSYRPSDGRYGIIGATVLMASYGTVLETIRADNDKGYRDVGEFTPSAMSIGVGYARAVTNQFSFGGHLKYARQSLGRSTMRLDESDDPIRSDNQLGTIVGDFGVRYNTGFRSLTFAFAVQNFSRELTYAQESFELPLTFNVGMAMDVLDLTAAGEQHHFLVSVDARRPRDYDEQIRWGAEYVFMDVLALRGGYTFPADEKGLSIGAGLNFAVSSFAVGADYAFTQWGRLGNVNRVAVNVSL